MSEAKSMFEDCKPHEVANLSVLYGKIAGLFPYTTATHMFFIDYDTSKQTLDREIKIEEAHPDLYVVNLEEHADDVESVKRGFMKFCYDMWQDRLKQTPDLTLIDVEQELFSIVIEHSMACGSIVQAMMSSLGLDTMSNIYLPKPSETKKILQ